MLRFQFLNYSFGCSANTKIDAGAICELSGSPKTVRNYLKHTRINKFWTKALWVPIGFLGSLVPDGQAQDHAKF